MKSNMVYFDFTVKMSSRHEREIHKYHLIDDIVNDSFMHMQFLTLSFFYQNIITGSSGGTSDSLF